MVLKPTVASLYFRLVFLLCCLLALFCFWLGIHTPVLTVKKLIVVKNTFSIYEGIEALLHGNTRILGIFLFVFTLIFPIVKIALMMLYAFIYPNGRHVLLYFHHVLGRIAKFSMADVFALTLMVMILKLGVIVSVVIHDGIYWFSASVLIQLFLGVFIDWDIYRRSRIDGR